jgi:hypothetical protein
MSRQHSNDWEVFASSNSDLLVWKDGILGRSYEEATLRSDFARTTFVLPDKCLERRANGAVDERSFQGELPCAAGEKRGASG